MDSSFNLCVSVIVSVPCSLVVTCQERTDLLVTFFLVFITYPYGILGQVWYVILSIPDVAYFLLNQTNGELAFFPEKIILKMLQLQFCF